MIQGVCNYNLYHYPVTTWDSNTVMSVLTPVLTIYHCCQFYWWRKAEKTNALKRSDTSHWQTTVSNIISSTHRNVPESNSWLYRIIHVDNDCICRCQSKDHMITSLLWSPLPKEIEFYISTLNTVLFSTHGHIRCRFCVLFFSDITHCILLILVKYLLFFSFVFFLLKN